MMSIEHYGKWPELAQVYLEDSFVLEIKETADTLTFDAELVLREGHPAYRVPTKDKQYCYKRGRLIFSGARDVTWHQRKDVKSWDATGEHDMGNIDLLYRDNGWYNLQGDWGKVQLHAERVYVEL
jgi:hypothetical protein